MRIGVIDLGVGSVHALHASVRRVCSQLRHPCETVVVSDPLELRSCARVVFGPTGSFQACSAALSQGMGEALLEHLQLGRPCLAVSLGMALLFERSDQAPDCPGLGALAGNARGIPPSNEPISGLPARLPHLGWNRLLLTPEAHPVVAAAGRSGTWMYFAHDHDVVPDDAAVVTATVEHGAATLVAAVARDSLVGTQFRPDRSHRAGTRFLVAFMERG
jgi:glutamine amidotransferase